MTIEDISMIHGKYYTIPLPNQLGIVESNALKNCDIVSVCGFKFNVHKNDTCVSDCLRSGELFEKFIISLVQPYIDPQKNIIDLGANIGTHSVIYCNFLTSGKVYSFEPQPLIFDILTENLRINNCTSRSKIFNVGASDSSSRFFMNATYDVKENQGAFRIINDTSQTGIYIDCVPIDSLNITNVGYIKIDVEGHEYKTLKGMKNTILQNKPTMLIEIHDGSIDKKATFNMLEHEFGYTKYIQLTHCDYLFLSNNFIRTK
jgi:FkbM family methyltransferase